MGSVSSLSWRHSIAQRRAATDQASRSTVQVGLLEKGCVRAQPPSPGPLMWVRGSLMLPLIRNESVCFQLNISPNHRQDGTAHSRFLAAWETVLWVLPGHFSSSWWPHAHPQGPGVWLPARMGFGYLGQKVLAISNCLSFTCPSRCHYSLPSDLISIDANFGHWSFTRHSENKHSRQGNSMCCSPEV